MNLPPNPSVAPAAPVVAAAAAAGGAPPPAGDYSMMPAQYAPIMAMQATSPLPFIHPQIGAPIFLDLSTFEAPLAAAAAAAAGRPPNAPMTQLQQLQQLSVLAQQQQQQPPPQSAYALPACAVQQQQMLGYGVDQPLDPALCQPWLANNAVPSQLGQAQPAAYYDAAQNQPVGAPVVLSYMGPGPAR